MAYQANIPLATDQLSQSQGDIQGNFQAIGTWVPVDHTDFNSAIPGQHNFVTFPVQIVDPAVPSVASTVRLYNKAYDSGAGARSEVFLQRTTGNPIPVTAALTNSSGLGATGWTYLPSGVMIKWGAGTCAAGVAVVNLNAVGPAYNAIFNVQLTPRNDVGTVGTLSLNSTNPANFTANSTAANTQFIWVAFGTAPTP